MVQKDKSLTCQLLSLLRKKMNYVFNHSSEAQSCGIPSQPIVWLLEQVYVMSGTTSNPAQTTQRHSSTSHSFKVRVWHLTVFGQGIIMMTIPSSRLKSTFYNIIFLVHQNIWQTVAVREKTFCSEQISCANGFRKKEKLWCPWQVRNMIMFNETFKMKFILKL